MPVAPSTATVIGDMEKLGVTECEREWLVLCAKPDDFEARLYRSTPSDPRSKS